MHIVVEVSARDPPCGWVIDPLGEHHGFDGWLDLLRVLSEIVEPSDRR